MQYFYFYFHLIEQLNVENEMQVRSKPTEFTNLTELLHNFGQK